MISIIKGAQKDAKMVHKIVRLQMSFLYWMKNYSMKSDKADKVFEKILSDPEIGIRDTVTSAYDVQERQVYWKAFHDEYNRLVKEVPVIP